MTKRGIAADEGFEKEKRGRRRGGGEMTEKRMIKKIITRERTNAGCGLWSLAKRAMTTNKQHLLLHWSVSQSYPRRCWLRSRILPRSTYMRTNTDYATKRLFVPRILIVAHHSEARIVLIQTIRRIDRPTMDLHATFAADCWATADDSNYQQGTPRAIPG